MPRYDVQFSAWIEVEADTAGDVHTELLRELPVELDTIMSISEIKDASV